MVTVLHVTPNNLAMGLKDAKHAWHQPTVGLPGYRTAYGVRMVTALTELAGRLQTDVNQKNG